MSEQERRTRHDRLGIGERGGCGCGWCNDGYEYVRGFGGYGIGRDDAGEGGAEDAFGNADENADEDADEDLGADEDEMVSAVLRANLRANA
ncbi:MAG: hypothetical protein ACRDP1_15225 [Nocardioidaceae bacterium]